MTPHILGRCVPVACLGLLLGAELMPTFAQQASVAAMSQNEVRRRALVINKAGEEIQRGYVLIEERKAEEALALFTAAYEAIPDVPMAQEHRAAARNGYVSAGCLHVQDLAARGDLEAANKLLDELLAAAPNDARALGLKKRLGDPDRFPPALTAKHVGNVEAVHALLIKANSFLELGDPDKANTTYQEVLRIDPHNGAARRGMEAAENFKRKYFNAAYDQQRSKMLAKVDEAWEDPVPLQVDVSAMFGASNAAPSLRSGRESIVQKLRTLTVPQLELTGVTLDEATELLKVRSRDLDPEGRGVNFIVNVPPEGRNKPITLNLFSVPLEEVLRYISETAGVSYKVDEHAVIFTSVSERGSAMISRSFRVPPDFIQNSPVGTPPPAANADPFANAAPAGGALVVRRMGAKEFLEGRGVSFPEGASASFNNATSTLTVRNTVENMEMIELFVEQATKSAPKMAVIQVRMLEVNQTNLEELGFDTLLGGVGTNGNNLFFGGGSAGNGAASSATNFPFQSPYTTPAQFVGDPLNAGALIQVFPPIPTTGAFAGPVPSGTTAPYPYGGGPISSGLRSGSYAVAQNSLDALLRTGSANSSAQVAPGVLSVAGVFTDPQFQTVMRALSQKKGVDINASPSVTTKNGIKATVEITREIIYPTEFDPPQLPPNGNGTTITIGATLQPMIATPTTPTAFETRKTGVLLDVEPIISEDGRTVELTITPELSDFEGFINYGSAIYSPASRSVLSIQLGGVAANAAATTGYIPVSSPEQLITPNLILQPVFKTQKVATAVKVWDGATVVLGGAKVQSRQMVNDKIPLLGDLPFVGRFFRSDVNQSDTKNVIIFVTVNVVDPSGQRVNRDTVASGASTSAAAAVTQ